MDENKFKPLEDWLKEAKQGCHNCQHAGLLGGNEKDPVAVAHCIIHKENHRLPYGCDDWQQREEEGGSNE